MRLATLLENDKDYSKQSKARAMFQRAAELNPFIGGQPYVEFLGRRYDTAEAAELYGRGTANFPAEALLDLGKQLRFKNPAAAKDLFTRALQGGSAPAALYLYRLLFVTDIDQARKNVLDMVLEHGPWFPEVVVQSLENEGETSLAQELKKRIAKNTSEPAQRAQP